MMLKWYENGRQVLALRKHTMRVDLHVHAGDETDFNNENDMNSSLKGVLTAAIIKGLDVIGVVAHTGPAMGWKARQLALESDIDIWVIPGQEYVTADKVRMVVYLLEKPLPPNLMYEQAAQLVHKQRGWIMAISLSKRSGQMLNKLSGTPSSPDAIEIYNATTGGYQDVEMDPSFHRFVSSAAHNAHELEITNVFTLIQRKKLEEMGLLPPEQGANYIPPYLQRAQEIEEGANPADLAEGNIAASPNMPGQAV